MIKIEKTEVMGWEAAIRGARNPMNSWGKGDSEWDWIPEYPPMTPDDDGWEYILGPNDYDLMKRLRNAGTDHRKYMRMITVYVDLTAPLYWWKEFDTYKIGTVANSCSTMHKIHAKEFTIDDFSHEHMHSLDCAEPGDALFIGNVRWDSSDWLELTIKLLNYYRDRFLATKDKQYWWQMIQMLPTSYNQKRTVMLNYEVLANIYKSRKNHKLDEWHTFCDWIKNDLPYSELITGEFKE